MKTVTFVKEANTGQAGKQLSCVIGYTGQYKYSNTNSNFICVKTLEVTKHTFKSYRIALGLLYISCCLYIYSTLPKTQFYPRTESLEMSHGRTVANQKTRRAVQIK